MHIEWRRAWCGYGDSGVPEVVAAEGLAADSGVVLKGYDFHFRKAVWADEGIDFPDFFD